KRGAPPQARRLDVSAALKEQLHHRHLTEQHGLMKGRGAVRGLPVDRCPRDEEPLGCRGVPPPCGEMKRRKFRAWASFLGIGPTPNEQVNDRGMTNGRCHL